METPRVPMHSYSLPVHLYTSSKASYITHRFVDLVFLLLADAKLRLALDDVAKSARVRCVLLGDVLYGLLSG